MCGICGAIALNGRAGPVLAPGVLDAMTDVMVHRGPDDRGVYEADGVGLGVRRLSIVDIDGGHQPLADEDGLVWAIQNGEIYNHEQIRARLARSGHRFRTRCDTEVIPYAYKEFGKRFAEQLNGMFAIAVWDERARCALLVRDRLGIKPLYYACQDDVLVFGSELKSVLASGLVEPDLDVEAIDAYLNLGFFPAPTTPLRAVRKLPPGCLLVVQDGQAQEERWWRYPEPAPPAAARSLEEDARDLVALLRDAVRLELMGDVPVGAMLSGGLDSSLLVTLMALELGKPVQTFSVAFAEDRRTGELGDARRVAEAIGSHHHELELSLSERQVDLPELVWHLDEPIADLSSLGFLQLSAVAAEHVKVALCGQGPDELYGGYDKHRAAALLSRTASWPPNTRARVGASIGRMGGRLGRIGRSMAADSGATRLLAMSGLFSPELRERLARGALAELDAGSALRLVASLEPSERHDPLSETLHIDGQLALVDDMLHYTDRMSMAHSLEVRVPYLDHRLVEQSAMIPSLHKVRGSATKLVLKRAARGLVLDAIVDKRKIGFFSLTTNAWLEEQVSGPMVTYLLDPAARFGELLDRTEVERLVMRHRRRSEKHAGRLLLAILMLEVWLSTYLPRALANAPRRDLPAILRSAAGRSARAGRAGIGTDPAVS
jgi:asparagine synthase (glutamine-hydrolysing)